MRHFFVPILGLLFFLLLVVEMCVWPNTYLSQIDISYWPKPVIRKILVQKINEPVKLSINGVVYPKKLSELGVEIDVDETVKEISDLNLLNNLRNWFLANKSTTIIQPKISFQNDFNLKMENLIGKNILVGENVIYKNDRGMFIYSAKNRPARVDMDDLKIKLSTLTRQNDLIEISLIYESTLLEATIEKVNKSLMNVFGSTLELVLDYPKNKVSIKPSVLKAITEVAPINEFEKLKFTINEERLKEVLTNKEINIQLASNLISSNLQQRYEKGILKPVVLGVDTGPNSDGTVANKYIEIDISQQMMYFFQNGEVLKNYRVSTGLDYPTPVGNYKIINRMEMGYSGIYKVWMPYWMAFDFRDDIHAYVGIHELPYRLNGNEKIYRFGNYIGQKKTGGCVALSPGDSKEVYDMSQPGMDVVIYQ